MKNKFLLRIILDVVLLGSALTPAWWTIFPIGIICAWSFKNFYEFPLAALTFDVLYSAPREKFFGFEYIYTLIALIIFVIISVLKTKVRGNIWRKDF